MYRFIIILLGILCNISQSQKLPNLGSDPSYLLENRQEINKKGQEIYQGLLRKNRIYQSQKDSEYINYLAGKISLFTKINDPLFLYLVKDSNVNAFATPGGYIGVNTGLILATENEHELVGVIAHEIAHVSLFHIERGVVNSESRKFSNVSAIIAGIAVGFAAKDTQLGAGIVTGVNANEIQNKINDIRGFEIAADDLAKELIEKSGFDISGIQSFFLKLSKKIISNSSTPNYLRTHPIPSDRIANLDELYSNKNLLSSEEYHLLKARMIVDFSDTKVAISRIKKIVSSKNKLSKDAGWYAHALLNLKLGAPNASIDFRQKMTSKLKTHRDVLLLQAELYDFTNQSKQANKIYESLWKNHKGDMVVAENYARFLVNQNRLVQAEKILSNWVDESEAYSLILIYVDVLAKQGKNFEKSKLLMRFNESKGAFDQALFHANEALKAKEINWQDKVATEAKKRELEKQIRKSKNILF